MSREPKSLVKKELGVELWCQSQRLYKLGGRARGYGAWTRGYGVGARGYGTLVIKVSPKSQLDFDFDLGLLLVWV